MDLHAPILLDLPPEALAALRAGAQAAGMSPSEHAARLLSKTLIRDTARTPAQTEERSDLLAPLRALLAVDLLRATGWADLQDRMSGHGYTFREHGGGLALYSTTTAARICKASALGWPYADLFRRFDALVPGHSHTHIAERALKRAVAKTHKHPSLFPDPGAQDNIDDDLILFEDE